MATATLEKKAPTIRRFRTRSVNDTSRRGMSRKSITIPVPLKSGDKFMIRFITVPQKGSLAPDYCAYDVSEEATFPKDTKDKALSGKNVIEFLKEQAEFRNGTIYEDLVWFHNKELEKEAELQKELEKANGIINKFDSSTQNKENE